jgi:peroxiredoxin
MKMHPAPVRELPGSVEMLMAHVGGSQGQSLLDMVAQGPTLLVFLRHLGCVFCRQTLSDLREAMPALDARGIRVALVHMASDRQAELIFRLYGMDTVARFSDPDRSLYEAMGLRRVSMRELMSRELFKRGFEACVRERHAMSVPRGDPMQMPGIFLVERGIVLATFLHEHPWDRPCYKDFAGSDLAGKAVA